jgi:antitoxin (DNA-binding transcriptional repressor) of toxin-antitoxin stability system
MQDRPRIPHPAKATQSKVKEKSVGVTAFKAKCLALIDAVAKGRIKRVVLTKRGKPVAEIAAAKPAKKKPYVSSYGFMKGLISVTPGVDLTAPIPAEWNADKGILYWGKDGPVYADDDGSAS